MVHRCTARRITACIKIHYRACYPTWIDTPISVQNMWFEEFKKCYRWAPEIEGRIREPFNKVAKTHLRDALGNAQKYVRAGRPPPSWISDTVWAELQRYWATDESFNKLSESERRNIVSDNDGG